MSEQPERGLVAALEPVLEKMVENRFKEIHKRIEDLTAQIESRRGVGLQQDNLKIPPRPKRAITISKKGEQIESREFLVKRKTLQGTVDAALYKLFGEDRAARGLGVSAMIDTILWNYYGRPKLSFEE